MCDTGPACGHPHSLIRSLTFSITHLLGRQPAPGPLLGARGRGTEEVCRCPQGLRAQRVGLAQKPVGTGLHRGTAITPAGCGSTGS